MRGRSLHCELASCASENFISYDNFLGSSPPVLMAPHISPSPKVGHGHHWTGKSANEWLSSDYREEEESCSWSCKSILKSSKLIARYPVVTVLEILFGLLRNIAIVDEPVNKLSLLCVGGFELRCRLSEVGLLRLSQNCGSGINL